MVGVGRHDISHMLPPLLAYGGLGDGLPLRFVLDLDIGKELVGPGMKEDGVVMCSVLLRTASNSGHIGLWRCSYSFTFPGFTDITNALRIIFMNF